MNLLAALAVGYLVGARTGGKDLDQLGRSLLALGQTDEFAEVVAALRLQFAGTLRDLASILDADPSPTASSGDLVARVRHLVGRQ